jgi:hypothetical protein
MSDGKIIPIGVPKHYAENDALLKEIKDVIYARAERISVAEVLGVLRLIEHDIIRDNQ